MRFNLHHGTARFGTDVKVGRGSIWNMYKQMFRHVRSRWGLLLLSFFCIAAIALLEFLIPQLTQYTIDHVIPAKQAGPLLWIALSILGAALLLGVCHFVSSLTMAAVAQQAIFELRNDLYRHIQSLDMKFFDRNRTGDLMSRVTSDINSLQQLISSGMLNLVTDVFTFVVIAGYMLYANWLLTVILLATFPMLFFTTRFFGKRLRKSFKNVQESVAEVSSHLQDTLSSMRLIKAFHSEAYEAGRFQSRSRTNMNANLTAAKLRSVYEPIIDWINYLGFAAVLIFGAWLTMGESGFTIGAMVAFLAYLRLLQNPVRRFSRIIAVIQQSAAAYERIAEILDTKARITEKPDAVQLPPMQGHIIFRNVNFSYQKNVPVLQQLQLEIAPGKMTALVGPSGSGKSTIAHLISRFYDRQKGSITIDGYPIQDVTLESLRTQMGIVSQDIVLMNESIRDNILYGKPDATEAEMLAAAKAANAHEFILSLPKGYDSMIGERGVKLSGGQKQRLSIARAVLKNPRLIILDEATASLDTEAEKLIQEALDQLLIGRTSLVIAHRLSTIQRADRIYVIERGHWVETGTHEELLQLGGRYKQLYELQFPQPSITS